MKRSHCNIDVLLNVLHSNDKLVKGEPAFEGH